MLRRSPNGATIVRMVTSLRIVLSCLLVASLAGCGGGSQATSPPDAPTVMGGIVGPAGTGGGPGGESEEAAAELAASRPPALR